MPVLAPQRRALWAAAFFAAGILAAEVIPPLAPPIWFLASLASLAVAIPTRGRVCGAFLCIATMFFGAGWHAFRDQTIPGAHVARRLGDAPSLVIVEGTIVSQPRVSSDRQGRLGRFFPPSPRTFFTLRAEVLDAGSGGDESRTPTSGRLWVSVGGDVSHLVVGDRARITGMARAIPPPTNPGEHDRRGWARARSVGGTLDADAAGAIMPLPEESTLRRRTETGVLRLVERLRRSARAWIESPPDADEHQRQARALLRALLLGTHDRDLAEVDEAFMRLGLTHLLSISGLNLAILAGAFFVLLRFIGDRPRIEALIAAMAVLGYLLVIPVRAPVSRSAIMVLSLLAAETAGRRYDRLTILGWSMLLVLAIQPLELFSPGFQLSFGVVGALMTLATPVRRSLFGDKPPRDTHGPVRSLVEMTKDAAASSLVAWAVASPVIAYHVGVFSPLGVLATLLLMPIVSILMGAGYVALLVSLLIPAAGELAAPPLTILADWMARLAFILDSAPGSVIDVPQVSLAWTVLATVAVIWWLRPGGPTGIEGYSRAARLARAGCTAVAAAWLAFTLAAPSLPSGERVRLDTLDVGDGACHLIRVRAGPWAEEAALFDCGSLRLAVGERTIPQAIRALGARRVRTVILSHPNIDHYAAVLDLVQPLGVRRVCVGEAFKRAADRDTDGPVAHVLAELGRRGVEIRVVSAGDTIDIADARLDVLSPPKGAAWRFDNDASLVCALTPPPLGRRSGANRGGGTPDTPARTILLTGDIQRDAILALRERHPGLRADILEAPHHGSYNPTAEEFIAALDPVVVVQSTGPRRAGDARWADQRNGRTWCATAEAGAVSTIITSGNDIRTESSKR